MNFFIGGGSTFDDYDSSETSPGELRSTLCQSHALCYERFLERHVSETFALRHSAARNTYIESMNADGTSGKVKAATYSTGPNDFIHQDLPASDLSNDEQEQSSSTSKPHHRTKQLAPEDVSTRWSMVHTAGVGLRNTDRDGKCLNICYMNGVIQCLANATSLAQWLLDDRIHGTCKLLNRERHNRMYLVKAEAYGGSIRMQRDPGPLRQKRG